MSAIRFSKSVYLSTETKNNKKGHCRQQDIVKITHKMFDFSLRMGRFGSNVADPK